MTTPYQRVCTSIAQAPRTWLVTGGAGFIGSHLVETLLRLDQRVVVVDDFSTGRRENLAPFSTRSSFSLIEGRVDDGAVMQRACAGVDIVLHQAALGSVPRSLADPRATHRANVDGFVVTALAARDAGVTRFVYASSSSVYGDHPALPKVEEQLGKPLSPYAATKRIDEIYARTFQDAFGFETVGLRYFNVFGPRQDPNGPYAAVIPRWVKALLAGAPCEIHGDGETSRDFCFVENAVQANLLAAVAPKESTGGAYNVACGARTTLNTLFGLLRDGVAKRRPDLVLRAPAYTDFRPGDVRHSLADISLARDKLGYAPTHDIARGLDEALGWYVGQG